MSIQAASETNRKERKRTLIAFYLTHFTMYLINNIIKIGWVWKIQKNCTFKMVFEKKEISGTSWLLSKQLALNNADKLEL